VKQAAIAGRHRAPDSVSNDMVLAAVAPVLEELFLEIP
jgi:hypothetical protein